MNTINCSEFKAKCLSILDDVANTGEGITILKRGKPVAQLLPVVPRHEEYPQHTLKDTMEIYGDIVEPPLPETDWDVERDRS